MRRRIRKWGNSLAVRIPAEIARISHISEGVAVEMTYEDGSIVIALPGPRRTYDLRGLVDRITDENRHEPVDWGTREGRETW